MLNTINYRYRVTTRFFPLRSWLGKRLEPSFFIIGAQKAATSSLYSYISQSANFIAPRHKELQYLNNLPFNSRTRSEYLQLFPRTLVPGKITGEATPFMANPLMPERLHGMFEDAKLIVILRDPVDRALSHWKHNLRAAKARGDRKVESTFIEALKAEPEKTKFVTKPFGKFDAIGYPINYGANYIERGLYGKHLGTWLKHYPPQQVILIDFEKLILSPDKVMETVCSFLAISSSGIATDFNAFPSVTKSSASENERGFAKHFFERSNEKLKDLMSRNELKRIGEFVWLD